MLYPPIVETYSAAFVTGTDAVCRVRFSIPPYNSTSALRRMHVSVVDMTTNETVIDSPLGYKIVSFSLENHDSVSNSYYVDIKASWVKGGTFKTSQFYKVQLRFDESDAVIDDEISYVRSNQDKFSEWSRVTLIRPISKPSFGLFGIDMEPDGNTDVRSDVYLYDDGTSTKAYVNRGVINLYGQVAFEGGKSETETLQSYYVTAQYGDSTITSDVTYTTDSLSPNVVNTSLDLQGTSSSTAETLRLTFHLTTKNQYQFEKTYDLYFAQQHDPEWMAKYLSFGIMDTPADRELLSSQGIVRVVAKFQPFAGRMIIRRGSSEDGFKRWDVIYDDEYENGTAVTITVNGGGASLTKSTDSTLSSVTIEDDTVQSFYKYQYSLQVCVNGVFSTVRKTKVGNDPQMVASVTPIIEYSLLSSGSRQLNLMYDFKISAVKPVVSRSKIDTLGSRYPKFIQNDILGYKQFSVSGIISSQSDVQWKFIDKKSYFGENYSDYLDYMYSERNSTESLAPTSPYDMWDNDYFWEREFREEAVKWLNDGEVKLFRSLTEGNLCVVLSDISLAPIDTLGNRLYRMSGTMYEVGPGTRLDVLAEKGVYRIKTAAQGYVSGDDDAPSGKYDHKLVPYQLTVKSDETSAFHLVNSEFSADVVQSAVYDDMRNRYVGHWSESMFSDRNKNDLSLDGCTVTFLNRPHQMTYDGSRYVDLRPSDAVDPANITMGYVMQARMAGEDTWQTVFVNERGTYKFPDGAKVVGLRLRQHDSDTDADDTVIISGIASYYLEPDTTQTPKLIINEETVVGQLEGPFKAGESVSDEIFRRYTKYDRDPSGKVRSVVRMNKWRGLSLDVTPMSVVRLFTDEAQGGTDVEIGPTGTLRLMPDFSCNGVTFLGRRMTRKCRYRGGTDSLPSDVTDGDAWFVGPGLTSMSQRRPLWGTDNSLYVGVNGRWENMGYMMPLKAHEYVDETTFRRYETTASVPSPQRGHVYSIGGSPMIYHLDGRWYPFDMSDTTVIGGTPVQIAAVPVNGYLNYYGDVDRNVM